MMRILSWSSGLGCDKTHTPDFNMFVPNQQMSSVTSPLVPASVKRKRSPSLDDQAIRPVVDSPPPDRHEQEDSRPGVIGDNHPTDLKQEFSTPTDLPTPPYITPLDSQLPVAKSTLTIPTDAQLHSMRQTISSQLSLEILIKHKELRLIDQEMAKCQVALEQLRRCHEIPYPGTQRPSALVSEGRGPAVRRASERYPAESPAPWGVTDGPYTRHYSRWLLPDRKFDGGESEIVYPPTNVHVSASGRSTRGHVVDLGLTSGKSRSQRVDLKSLPAGYGQPKEKATGPMILKRKSDNTMVKLVCPDCGRHDFGSAQGFINHCRIGHSRSFASHDAAAEACGEPVEYNDNGTVKGVEPVVIPSSNTSVHPLVRSAKLMPETPGPIFSYSAQPTFSSASQQQAQGRKAVSPDFHASTQTPNLSALIKNRGLGLDLHSIVTDAKSKITVPEPEDDFEEMDVDSLVPINTGRHPQVAGSKQPSKSIMGNGSSAILQSRLPLASSNHDSQQSISTRTTKIADNRRDSFPALLPSPTNESTQAPSLVDDDEEFDAQSPMSTDDVDEDDTPEVDFEVHDEEQADRVPNLRGSDITTSQTTCAPVSAPTAQSGIHQQSVAARALGANGRVDFGSPSPVPEGSDRKRRRIEGN